jgi:alkylation response protein AidB-like acyl-CoA dehydrogenase
MVGSASPGNTPAERFFRDARIKTIGAGTTQIQKLTIGREILGISAMK